MGRSKASEVRQFAGLLSRQPERVHQDERGEVWVGYGRSGWVVPSICFYSVVQSRPFDLLVFLAWSIFSRVPKG